VKVVPRGLVCGCVHFWQVPRLRLVDFEQLLVCAALAPQKPP
jgi:hypothetical protein